MLSPADEALKARLRPLYATAFIQNFVLWYSIEKLFMAQIGFSAWLITVATVIYVLVMAAANVPLGLLADRWSRKGMLQVATCCLIGSTVICGLAHGFAVYAAGYVVWGVFYAAQAGTYDSLVYDVVVEVTGSRQGYEAWYGKVQRMSAAAFVAGALATAALVHLITLRLSYFLTVPVTCLAFATLARFREPLMHRKRSPARLHLRQLHDALTASPRVMLIAAALACDLLAVRLLEVFCQLWWIGVSLPTSFFGVSYAILYVGNYGGGRLAARAWPCGLVAAVGLAASLGLLIPVPPVIVTAQVLVMTALIILQVALLGSWHDVMPAGQRAGASSAPAAASMLVFVPTALGFGAVAGDYGIFQASWFLIGTLAALTAAVLFSRQRASRGRHRRPRPGRRPPGRARLDDLALPSGYRVRFAGHPALSSGRDHVRTSPLILEG